MQVELAHGGRGPPLSLDRYNGYGSASGGVNRGMDVGGRTGGVSRRSEYRGWCTSQRPGFFPGDFVALLKV